MKARGFTLMEMIVTIVIGSFIMLGIAGYVQLGMKGYADTIDRQRIQTQAQFVLEKMTREIRHAVPNSFHVPKGTTNCLEFMPIEYSGFYTFKNNDLEFLLGNDSTLNPIPANRRIVINPSRYEDLQSTSSRNIAIGGLAKTGKVFVVSGGASTITGSSVSSRLYIYQEKSEVRYCFDTKQVTRNGITVADSVDTSVSSMRYLEPTLQRGGLVHINLEFEQDGERSVYQQDVQVLNVP
ncbi:MULTISPECIES: PilW family protein [Vibrio]|uniref:PilW family protein n=1 Tax=Vibrio TaxID=662 RepID=UPI00215BF712|nr:MULTISPECIES: prepilin-type N-terminal cleavage/methylation domain-containing protein [Vibrio]MCR9539093.1 prepilin-type N-terminal cleavage/methylation domain-containing protein [Vibrio alginolyticus]MCS0176252.1 prepilin-type N-terminal cleavage/methylation domain-containing protein [Vibrio alginolyticus]MDW1852872.1 prepilin-type N-terminal cleavage/methylation domain-containing protein [Vibrio sp. Vb0888]